MSRAKLQPPGRIPVWAGNLVLFGLLIAIVLAVFFWQMHRFGTSMQYNALGRAKMVAAVIENNLRSGLLTGQTIDTIVTSFLRDKAKFVEYLDSVEPLQAEELSALARETGLLGITLVRPGSRTIAGPEGWLPEPVDCSRPDGRLFFSGTLAGLVHHRQDEDADLKCIIVGLDADHILALRRQTSLPVLIDRLTRLPGINFIHLDKNREKSPGPEQVTLRDTNGSMTAVARLQTDFGTLTVGLDANNFIRHRNLIRNQFIFFALLLLGLGLLFSWLLYRSQQRELRRNLHYQHVLAREHEDAALGRATATIAHEIRNPLNAINLGLQRLQIESTNLEQDQLAMLTAMREAVGRTSTIINELQRFTRRLEPEKKPVQLGEILDQLLTLYKPELDGKRIRVELGPPPSAPVTGDWQLLSELLENLLKNSIEAQQGEGFIRISFSHHGNLLSCSIANSGFHLTAQDRDRPGEPYFSTKTRGTGLGLALCRRIAEAHNGRLKIDTSGENIFTVTLTLPLYRD